VASAKHVGQGLGRGAEGQVALNDDQPALLVVLDELPFALDDLFVLVEPVDEVGQVVCRDGCDSRVGIVEAVEGIGAPVCGTRGEDRGHQQRARSRRAPHSPDLPPIHATGP
jgi:hypothetical protein